MGPEGGLGQPSVRPHKVKFFIFAKAFILLYFSRPTTRMGTDRGQIDRDVVFHWPTKGSKKNYINFSCWKNNHIFIFLIVPCMIGQYCWLDFLFCYFILGLWSLALLLIRYIPTTYDIFIIWFEASSSGCSSSLLMILLCYLWKALQFKKKKNVVPNRSTRQ